VIPVEMDPWLTGGDISPIGRTTPDEEPQLIVDCAARVPSRIGAILTKEDRSYDLTVEDDVLLGAPNMTRRASRSSCVESRSRPTEWSGNTSTMSATRGSKHSKPTFATRWTMAREWRAFCRGERLQFDGDDIVVSFDSGRRHRVQVHDTDGAYELHAVVARAAAVKDVPDVPLRIWRHNRGAQLVSFRIDTRERVYAEGWVLKAGLEPQEFQLVLRHVAAESDRLEFLLTGRDVE